MSAHNPKSILNFQKTALLAAVCLLIAPQARAVPIAPKGTYEGQITTICQATTQKSNTGIIQSSVTPIYSTVKLAISGGATASFASAQNLVTNNLISSSVTSPGSINQGIANLTFTPSATGATSGKLSGYSIEASGSLTLTSSSANPPTDIAVGQQPITGTYSATATTLTMTIDKTKVYQVLYFKPSAAGVPTDFNLVGISGKNCSVSGHFSLN